MDKLNPSTYITLESVQDTHTLTALTEVDADGDGKAGFMK
jgi:hypothetical protein